MEDSATKESSLAALIRQGDNVSLRSILLLTVRLSVPAIMAQIAAVAMEYIDASMVGHLGADSAASIGLVATTTWLFMGLCSAAAMGFSVQVAHLLGARKSSEAKSVARQAYMATLIYSVAISLIGVGISPYLPQWLGGSPEIHVNASRYFLIFAISIPLMQYSFLTNGLLRCSGNMLVPGVMGVVMCVLDVVFNFLFDLPYTYSLATRPFTLNARFRAGCMGSSLGNGTRRGIGDTGAYGIPLVCTFGNTYGRKQK